MDKAYLVQRMCCYTKAGASERNITCEKSRQPVNRPSAYPAGDNFKELSRRYAE